MNAEQQAQEAAEQYRATHGLGTQPLGDLPSLIDLIEEVDVAVIPSPDPEGHGLTVTDPASGITVITAANTARPLRLRSTLAHELAHRVFDDMLPPSGEWTSRPRVEIRADNFARHLLMPVAALHERLGPPPHEVTEETLSDLVQLFEVSPQMIAIQLANNGYITERRKQEWMNLYAPALATRYGWMALYKAWRSQSQSVLPPQRLVRRATAGYAEGLVSADTIARLEHRPVEEVQADLDEAGIVVTPPTAVVADLD